MRYLPAALIGGLLLVLPAAAQHEHSKAQKQRKSQLMEGLGKHHRPIATQSAEAQKFFDQGLALIYGFNHDEAQLAFERAAELDPRAAMPQWGIAYCLGPNYNLPPDPEREKAAWNAIQKALALAKSAPEVERDFIDALAKRYSSDPKADRMDLARAYSAAMNAVMTKYPDDLDAATIFAESAMNLRPWQLYSADGKPAEGTERIVAVLEGVLRRDPEHPGANHYYIHAVEASTTPERGLPSADRLGSIMPNAGHIVHMPSHIYSRVGDFAKSAEVNVAAAEVDRKYIAATGATGLYPMMYYSHNLHFIAFSHAMQGRLDAAREPAKQLAANVLPAVEQMGMAAPFAAYEHFLLLRFRRFDEILSAPAPTQKAPAFQSFYRFARGAALAGKGQAQEAETERKLFEKNAAEANPDDMMLISPYKAIAAVARLELAARIARAKGDSKAELRNWKEAVVAHDALNYSEPPDWYYPVRESYGAALIRKGDFAEAEKVFRTDIEKNPRNARSLFGLAEALKKQGKNDYWIRRQFESAWKGAPLSIDEL